METCDRHPSARAQWVIYVGEGMLYLCSHCYTFHKAHIERKSYRAKHIETQRADAGQRLGW